MPDIFLMLRDNNSKRLKENESYFSFHYEKQILQVTICLTSEFTFKQSQDH